MVRISSRVRLCAPVSVQALRDGRRVPTCCGWLESVFLRSALFRGNSISEPFVTPVMMYSPQAIDLSSLFDVDMQLVSLDTSATLLFVHQAMRHVLNRRRLPSACARAWVLNIHTQFCSNAAFKRKPTFYFPPRAVFFSVPEPAPQRN